MTTTKADLQAEVERLQQEIKNLRQQNKRQLDQFEEERARWAVLASQDNSLMHLLEEILRIEVRQVESGPRGARWEDRKIVWGFFQLPDGEELHRNESLSEGYRHIWNIDQEVKRMRREDEARCKDCGMRQCICVD